MIHHLSFAEKNAIIKNCFKSTRRRGYPVNLCITSEWLGSVFCKYDQRISNAHESVCVKVFVGVWWRKLMLVAIEKFDIAGIDNLIGYCFRIGKLQNFEILSVVVV